MGCVIGATLRPLYPQERDPVPILQEDGWASEPIGTVAEKLTLTEIRSPDHSPHS
jgi:hypothetical protein